MKLASDATTCCVRKLAWAVVLCTAACLCALAEDRAGARDPGVRPAGIAEPVSGVDADCFANLRATFREVYSIATEFMRYLKPPTPVEAFPGASAQSIERGSQLFTSVGCAYCHTPALSTGNLSNVPEMNNTMANLYSDLLLHHVGSHLADGITQGLAGPDEFRTPPLWGLGGRVFLLQRWQNVRLACRDSGTQEH